MKDKDFIAILRSTSLTITRVADALGVSQPTVRRWRNGVNLPSVSLRGSIVRVLITVEGRYC